MIIGHNVAILLDDYSAAGALSRAADSRVDLDYRVCVLVGYLADGQLAAGSAL